MNQLRYKTAATAPMFDIVPEVDDNKDEYRVVIIVNPTTQAPD